MLTALPHETSIESETRAVQVQGLKAPKEIEAHLPFGPEIQQAENDEESDALNVFNTPTEKFYELTVKRIECELGLICGTDPSGKAKHPS